MDVPVSGPPDVPELTLAVASSVAVELSWAAVTDATSYQFLWRAGAGSSSPVEEAGSGTSHVHDGLDPETDYSYQLRAARGSAYSGWSTARTGTTPRLEVPTGLTATGTSATAAALRWDAVAAATAYRLRREDMETHGSVVFDVSGTSYDDGGLSVGREYRYQVRSVLTRESREFVSDWSGAEATTPMLEPPADVTASAAASVRVELSWTAATGADAYEFQWSADGAATWNGPLSAGAGVHHEHGGLTPETAYAYQMRSKRGTLVSPWSSTATATTPKPGVPDGLMARATSATAVTLQWEAVDGADRYELRRRDMAGATTYQVIEVTGTSHDDTGLSPDTEYMYEVRSVVVRSGTTYESDWSGPEAVTPMLNAPAGLTATLRSSVAVELSWDVVTEATSYQFQWKAGTGAWTTEAARLTGTTHDHEGLAPQTDYQYQVRSRRGSGPDTAESEWSAPVTVSTPAPEVPTGLTAVESSPTSVTVTWDAMEAADRYNLRRQEMVGHTYQLTEVTGNAHEDTGLTAETEYMYQVQTVVERAGATYVSGWSDAVSATPMLQAPARVTATALSPVSVEIAWDAAAGTAGYRFRWMAGRGAWNEETTEITGTSYRHDGRDPETDYTYQVRSFLGTEDSPWSADAVATTPALAAPAGLEATAVSVSGATLAWDAVEVADSYNLRRQLMAGGAYTGFPVSGTTYDDSGLRLGTEYLYQVQSVIERTGGNHESLWSEPISVTPVLDPPGNVAAAANPVTVELSWDAVTAATGYEFHWKEGSGAWSSAVGAGSGTGFAHDGRDPDTGYSYELRSVRGSDVSGWSGPETVRTPVLPAPAGFSGAAASTSAVRLSWDAVDGADGYALERQSGGTEVLIPVTGTEHEDSGLMADTEYRYRIRSVVERSSGDLNSAWGDAETVTTDPDQPLEIPTGLTLTANSAFVVAVRWDEVEAAEEYDLRRQESGDEAWREVSATEESYDDSGLSPDTGYLYQVRSATASETSGWSDTQSVTTPVFAVPGDFLASATGATTVELTWDETPGTGVLYRIRWRLDGERGWDNPTDVTGDSYVVSGLAPGTAYEFRIYALYRSPAGERHRSDAVDADATTPAQ